MTRASHPSVQTARPAAPIHPGRGAGLVLAIGLWLGAPVLAGASCPLFHPEQTFMALFAIEGNAPALSPAQTRALVNSGVIKGFPVSVAPPSGPAPLRVGVLWIARPEHLQMIELDADGDGVPEVADTRDENLGHVYQTPGQYPATVRVRDQTGQWTTYKSPVTVLTPAAFDAELQARWATFKAAVGRKDVEGALECMISLLRDKRESAVRALLGKDLEQELPPIRFTEFRTVETLYVAVRPAPGSAKPRHISFQVDLDGVWRLADFRERPDD